jgi:hypothetical protein
LIEGRARSGNFRAAGHHGGAGADAELAKNTTEVSTNGPRADVKHVGDNLVRVSLRHHADYFLLAWAKPRLSWRGFGDANEQITHTVDFGIKDYFLGVGPLLNLHGLSVAGRDSLQQQANQFLKTGWLCTCCRSKPILG